MTEDDMKCTQGPTEVFPDTPQCLNKPVEYIFGDPYCKECADKLRKIHSDFCGAKP